MSQSNGVDRLKRIEFEFMGKTYRFNLNPEEYAQTESNRVTVTQTKRGAWIDDFGGGVPKITMKGTTGFKDASGDPRHGMKKFKELRDLIREVYSRVPPGTPITADKEMIFWNYTDGESWIVTPKVFSLKRSISRPLLYLYEIELICERPTSTPKVKSSSRTIGGGLEKVEVMIK